MAGRNNSLIRHFAKSLGYTSKSVLKWFNQLSDKDKFLVKQDMKSYLADVKNKQSELKKAESEINFGGIKKT